MAKTCEQHQGWWPVTELCVVLSSYSNSASRYRHQFGPRKWFQLRPAREWCRTDWGNPEQSWYPPRSPILVSWYLHEVKVIKGSGRRPDIVKRNAGNLVCICRYTMFSLECRLWYDTIVCIGGKLCRIRAELYMCCRHHSEEDKVQRIFGNDAERIEQMTILSQPKMILCGL